MDVGVKGEILGPPARSRRVEVKDWGAKMGIKCFLKLDGNLGVMH